MGAPGSSPLPEFADAEALAAALAARVADELRARSGMATLAVSGGTTPIRFFDHLSRIDLNWRLIRITLADERVVPADHPRSNEHLVREHLLRHEAAAAGFVRIQDLTAADLPLTAVILGMGLDGHTASLFPGADRLSAALTGPHIHEMLTAPGAPEPRLTLTLPVLIGAGYVALHIEGEAKRVALGTARHPGPVEAFPVRGVLARQPAPEIFWCP